MQFNYSSTTHTVSIVALASMLAMMGIAHAAESAYADLNECTRQEQIKLTAKGAAIGALGGFASSMLSGKKDDAGKASVTGAVVGGVAGFAISYFNAFQTCINLNPSWIPESQIVRDESLKYNQIIKEYKYNKKKDGIKVLTKKLNVPDKTKTGTSLNAVTTFDVMTPDGAETKVVIVRKLFVIEDGKETVLPYPGKASDERTVDVGRSIISDKIAIPPDLKVGTVLRFEVSVAALGQAPVFKTKTITVE